MFIYNEIAVDRLFVSDIYDCGSLLVICFYRSYWKIYVGFEKFQKYTPVALWGGRQAPRATGPPPSGDRPSHSYISILSPFPPHLSPKILRSLWTPSSTQIPKLIVYPMSGGGSSGKNYYGFGKGKGGRKGYPIIWEGPPGTSVWVSATAQEWIYQWNSSSTIR